MENSILNWPDKMSYIFDFSKIPTDKNKALTEYTLPFGASLPV